MTPAILTVERVAKMMQVSPATVRRWAEDGAIPAKKIGRRWYFSAEQLLAHIEGQGAAR